MHPSKQSLSLQLLITLSVLFDTITAASVLRRDPSTLINTRHPEPKPEPEPEPLPFPVPVPVPLREANAPGRRTISGHGVVAVPISPTSERVHVGINSSTSNQDQETNGGGSDPNSDSEYIKLVKVGDTTFQIIGTELTITDDRHDPSRPGTGASDGESNGNKESGLSDQKLTPGQLAAMEFAKTAEEIAAGKDHVLGGTTRPGGVDTGNGVELGLGQAQDHEQPLGIGRRRRQIRRLA